MNSNSAQSISNWDRHGLDGNKLVFILRAFFFLVTLLLAPYNGRRSLLLSGLYQDRVWSQSVQKV